MGDAFQVSTRPTVVGRTSASDLVFDWDNRISSRHLKIQRLAGEFIVTDLRSRNGTSVNGKEIQECVLHESDEIRLGKTLLKVRKIDSSADSTNPWTRVPTPTQTKGEDTGELPAPEPTIESGPIAAAIVECSSGVKRLQGLLPEGRSASDVMGQILEAYEGSLLVLLDFKRADLELPDIDVGASSPFQSIVPEAALGQLPLLLILDELPDWEQAVDAAWGKNGLVVLVTNLDKSEAVARLSDLISKTTCGRRHATGGALGICWPGILSGILSDGSKQVRQAIESFVDLIWIEDPDVPNAWQLYGSQAELDKIAAQELIEVSDSVATQAD